MNVKETVIAQFGGSRPPLGKRWNLHGELVDNEKEKMLISEVARLIDEGHSQNSVAQILSAQGYTNRIGHPIQRQNVYTILRKIREQEGEIELA